MAEYHFPVPGSVDEKKIVLFIRKHWAAYLGQFLLSIFLFFFPLVLLLIIYLADKTIFKGLVLNFLVLGFSTYYLIISTFVFTSWLSFYYDIYIITEDSIIDVFQQGFFGRRIGQLSMLRVQDVSSSIEGLFPTLFAYGDVLVESAGEQTQHFVLEQVPNPQEVSSKIMELHNRIIETEGRHHQILEAEGAMPPGHIEEARVERALPYSGEDSAAEGKTQPEETLFKEPQPTSEEKSAEGEIEGEDLDKGGEVDFK